MVVFGLGGQQSHFEYDDRLPGHDIEAMSHARMSQSGVFLSSSDLHDLRLATEARTSFLAEDIRFKPVSPAPVGRVALNGY